MFLQTRAFNFDPCIDQTFFTFPGLGRPSSLSLVLIDGPELAILRRVHQDCQGPDEARFRVGSALRLDAGAHGGEIAILRSCATQSGRFDYASYGGKSLQLYQSL